LNEAGFQNIRQTMHVLDFSANTEAHQNVIRNAEATFKLGLPMLVQGGELTQEEAEQLNAQVQLDMLSDDFRGTWSLVTVWGTKP
jgi:predicted peptidase